MLPHETIESYLANLTSDQVESIGRVRTLIFELSPEVVETIDEGKWFGGMLTYATPKGTFLYALGPRKDGTTSFHMMPLYMHPNQALKESLKRFATGKSCIKFKRYEDLPEPVLREIMEGAPQKVQTALDARARKR